MADIIPAYRTHISALPSHGEKRCRNGPERRTRRLKNRQPLHRQQRQCPSLYRYIVGVVDYMQIISRFRANLLYVELYLFECTSGYFLGLAVFAVVIQHCTSAVVQLVQLWHVGLMKMKT